ncbi:unnamed protein product [Miscanthus lutarioriparius]|uniref:Uncharacterized protein n=1 Tax=Miscanthus lutarioriparius TaxID=422564 RepID=A0A811ML64_9POAL|nr:unnamed protein product [Miscanthus lutarioriparius]
MRATTHMTKLPEKAGKLRSPCVSRNTFPGCGGPTTTWSLDLLIAHVGETSSSHGAHGGGTSSSHGAATTAEGGQGHGHYDDEDDEGQGEYYDHEYDEIGMSQLGDAPQGTQGPSGSGRPHRTLRPVDRYTPGTYPFGRGKRYARRPR